MCQPLTLAQAVKFLFVVCDESPGNNPHWWHLSFLWIRHSDSFNVTHTNEKTHFTGAILGEKSKQKNEPLNKIIVLWRHGEITATESNINMPEVTVETFRRAGSAL